MLRRYDRDRNVTAMPSWLSAAGTASALAVGAAVWIGTGWRGVALLFVFLISASLLTPGGGRRLPVQVFANGGVAALCALLALADPAFIPAFAGAVAAAAADTWSSEIGARSATPPRLITTWARVPPGVSGGVTLAGTTGGLAGACVLAVAALLLGLVAVPGALWVALAGALGMTADSLLGATLQGRWRCAGCGAAVETASHCGVPAAPLRGISWLTNDAVNAAATLTGALVAALPAILRAARLT